MEFKSRTQKKKEALALQKLGEKLVELSGEQLENIDMPEEIYNAVKEVKSMRSHGARRRQMQYIGTLMRKIDPSQIEDAVQEIELGSYKKALAFKETEMWRDELIAGNKELMEEILSKYPDTDRQQLAQLVRNAVKEKKADKPPAAYRALFRYLVKARNR